MTLNFVPESIKQLWKLKLNISNDKKMVGKASWLLPCEVCLVHMRVIQETFLVPCWKWKHYLWRFAPMRAKEYPIDP